jgi:anti-sigma B factor antagonist
MKRLEIAARHRGHVVVLAIAGHLDGSTAPELTREIQNLLAEGLFNIVVDFKDLEFMSSAGLGVFMDAIQKVREKRGDIKLLRPNAGIRRLIDILGFTHIYQIFSDEDEALRAFR